MWLAFGSGLLSLVTLWRLIPWARRRGALDTAGHAGHVKVLRDVPNIGGLAFAAPSAGFGALGFGAWLGAGRSPQWLA